MARSETLRIEIIGDTASVRRAGAQAQASLKGIDKQAHTTSSRAGTAFGGIGKSALKAAGGVAAAYAGISAAKNAISTTTDLAKSTLMLSRNLGLSTKSASQWAAVAKSRSIDTRQLNMSFGTLSRQLSRANAGSEESVTAFKKLGITQSELKRGGKDFNFLLGEVAKGFGGMKGGAERTATSMQLMGRGWQTVLPLFKDGKKSLQEQLDLAEKYGVTFGGKSVKSIKDLIGAERELKFSQMGMQVQFTQNVAPALIAAFKGLAAASLWFKTAIKTAFDFIATTLTDFYNKNKQVFNDLKTIFNSVASVVGPVLGKAFTLFKGIVERTVPAIVLIIKGMANTIKGIIQIIAGILTLNFSKAWQGVKSIFKGAVNTIIGNLKAVTAPFREVVSRIGKAISGPLESAWNFVKKLVRNATNKVISIISGSVSGAGEVAKSVANAIVKAFNKVKDIVGKVGGFLKDTLKKIGSFVSDFFNKAVDVGKSVVKGIAKGLASIPGAIINAGKSLGEKIINAVEDFLGISSPSKRFTQLGIHIVEGLAKGFKVGDVPGIVKEHFGSMTSLAVKLAKKGLIDLPLSAFKKLGGAVSGLFKGESDLVKLGQSLQKLGFSVSEHPAFGGVNAVHAKNSWHYKGRAIDINADAMPGGEGPNLDWLAAALRKVPHLELLWRVKDHFDHLHFAMKRGGALSKRLTKPIVMAGEEAPRFPEYFISTNPRDKERSHNLLFQAAKDLGIAGFKKGKKKPDKPPPRSAEFFEQREQKAEEKIERLKGKKAKKRMAGARKTEKKLERKRKQAQRFEGRLTALGELGDISAGRMDLSQKLLDAAGFERAKGAQLISAKKLLGRLQAQRKVAKGAAFQRDLDKRIVDTQNLIADVSATKFELPEGEGDTSTDDNTAALEALQKELEETKRRLEEQNRLLAEQAANTQKALNVSQSQYGVLAQAIASVVSGQIGGKLGLGFQTPSYAGGLAKYS